MHRRSGLLVLTVPLALACNPNGKEPRAPGSEAEGDLGMVGASDERWSTGMAAPLDPADLEGITERGRTLATMERALRLANDKGLPRAGTVSAGALLPIASVDPGRRSGQVEFIRWLPEVVPEDGSLLAEKAQRWIIVPLLFTPDQILELDPMGDDVVRGTELHAKVGAILTAAVAATGQYPEGQWHFHLFREEFRQGTRRFQQNRIYALAQREGVPDLEITVVDPKRKKGSPEVTGIEVVSGSGAPGERTGRGMLEAPTVIDVARLVASQPEGDIECKGGNRYHLPLRGSLKPVG